MRNHLLKIHCLFCLSMAVFMSAQLHAQETTKRLNARFITAEIVLDGLLDEAIWETAERADDFWQFFPSDSLRAQHATEVRVLYDENTLYVGITALATDNDYVVSTLRRDFGGTTNDNVSLLFDTFNDGTNAFFFGVTPYGVQREGLVSAGGSDFNNTWDIKWQAESQRQAERYTVEIAIPFSSLKFREGSSSWRFRAYRWNLQTNEQSSWVRVPQNQQLSSLAFMGELVFEKPLGKSSPPIALIPYLNTLAQKDFVANATDSRVKVGGDAKIGIGNGMILDITANPDFSNVEVDDIFTNLTRFELFLPEKRQFFIDNNDLFGSFGSSLDAIPFFSRRVGLARDTLGNLIENRIIGGTRLSGKLDDNWRLGLLNIQTAADAPNEIASNNNAMIAVQRKVFSRSNIGAFLVNRETLNAPEYQAENDRYNRVLGIDYNLASPDNLWTGKFYVHKSLQPGDSEGNISSQAFMIYNSRNWRFAADFVYVDEEFRSDLGFVPRRGIFKTGQSATCNFYPKQSSIGQHGIRILALNFWRPQLNFQNTDHEYRLSWVAAFKNQSNLELRYSNRYVFLTNAFDPTRMAGGVPLPSDTGYYFNQFYSEYQSSPTNLLTYFGSLRVGEFFNGNSFSVSSRLGVRLQPWAQISLAVNYDGIRLPDPHPSADLWLVTPRFDITFSESLFWSTLFQYSNQRNNLGINSRLQWRFAPLSDLYLVYNDNYFTEDFSPRFRSINLKVSYWLNI